MHKKRGIAVAVIVLIVVLVMVFIASDYYYHINAHRMVNALKVMRIDPDAGFELCGELEIDDYAKDCYSTYLSVEIENIRAAHAGYESLEGEEKKQTIIEMLNEISEKTDRVCSLDLMRLESDTCSQVKTVIELQKDKVLSS